jgi:hypothetical protein
MFNTRPRLSRSINQNKVIRGCLKMKTSFPLLRLVGIPTAADRRGSADGGIPTGHFLRNSEILSIIFNQLLRFFNLMGRFSTKVKTLPPEGY